MDKDVVVLGVVGLLVVMATAGIAIAARITKGKNVVDIQEPAADLNELGIGA